MPRKRRYPKRRPILPEGLAQISLCERALWSTSGPIIYSEIEWSGDALVDSARPLYHVWPSWAAFMAFYAQVRADWLADRPGIGGAVEWLYTAWRRGDDLDALRDALAADGRANDARVGLQAVMRTR